MHIAQGVMKAINVNKMLKAGCHITLYVADWFAMMNNKLGGDLKKIRKCGEYFIAIWTALGMSTDQIDFVWSSEAINERPDEYWGLVLDIARRQTLARVMRCSQIMGREEGLDLSAAQIMYPCMQCADVFFLKADICQLGLDQRKVNMLAREYCDQTKRRTKPVILSHHMLSGLGEGQAKMSKSDPGSAIFMDDTVADVNIKIRKAFCPERVVADNPILDYCKSILFPWFGQLTVCRKEEYGGDQTYETYEALAADYEAGVLHPGDLKPAVSKALNEILEPVRTAFTDPKLKQLATTVKKYKTTR
jgi:tyrosyl-tRNA synthetase